MENVIVKRTELLKTVKNNRNLHRDVFLEAQKVFRAKVIEELDRRLSDARAGRKIDLRIGLPVPEDHTDDYDRVIKMLEMDTRAQIELSESDFAIYVMDQWNWRMAWTANTVSYANSGR